MTILSNEWKGEQAAAEEGRGRESESERGREREGGRGVPGQPRVVFLVAMATLAAFFKTPPNHFLLPFLPASLLLCSSFTFFPFLILCKHRNSFPQPYSADWHGSRCICASFSDVAATKC